MRHYLFIQPPLEFTQLPPAVLLDHCGRDVERILSGLPLSGGGLLLAAGVVASARRGENRSFAARLAQVFPGELSELRVEVGLLVDARQLPPRDLTVEAGEADQAEPSSLCVSRLREDARGGRGDLRIAAPRMLRQVSEGTAYVVHVPNHFDERRFSHLAQVALVEGETPLHVEGCALVVRRSTLPVFVSPKAQEAGQTEQRARGRPVFELRHLGAAVAVELCGQSVGTARVCDKRRVLFERQPGLGPVVILQRVERDPFDPPAYLFAQAGGERRVERKEKFELRVGPQPRGLVDVHSAATRDEVEDLAAEEVVKVA